MFGQKHGWIAFMHDAHNGFPKSSQSASIYRVKHPTFLAKPPTDIGKTPKFILRSAANTGETNDTVVSKIPPIKEKTPNLVCWHRWP
jgi:hypothetical protein